MHSLELNFQSLTFLNQTLIFLFYPQGFAQLQPRRSSDDRSYCRLGKVGRIHSSLFSFFLNSWPLAASYSTPRFPSAAYRRNATRIIPLYVMRATLEQQYYILISFTVHFKKPIYSCATINLRFSILILSPSAAYRRNANWTIPLYVMPAALEQQ